MFFDALQSTRARSDISFATSSFKVKIETSLPDAVTHNYCVLGATLVKRPANSLDIAVSVKCSAPTNPDRFFTVRYDAAFMQQRRTHALDPSCPLDGYCFLRYVVSRSEHCIRMHNALSFNIYCISVISYDW